MLRYKSLLFLHIPKTGGTWTQDILQKVGGELVFNDHDPLYKVYPYIFKNKLETVTTVRHPLLFVISLWKHWSGNPRCRLRNSSKIKRVMNWDKSTFSPTFCNAIVENDLNETLFNFSTKYPGFISYLYSCYMNNNTKLLHTENLNQELVNLLHQYKLISQNEENLILNASPVNVSKEKQYRIDKDLIIQFIDTEPICNKLNYTNIPSCITF